jgi:hypothetical protein
VKEIGIKDKIIRKRIIIFAVACVYLGLCVLTYGMNLAYFQNEYPIVAEQQCKANMHSAFMTSLFPQPLPFIVLLIETKFMRHGIQFTCGIKLVEEGRQDLSEVDQAIGDAEGRQDLRSHIIGNWKISERMNIQRYDSAVDQAIGDASIARLNFSSSLDIITYFVNYNYNVTEFVCRHRAARIAGDILIRNDTDEVCLVTGFVWGTSGITFLPDKNSPQTNHVWVEYHGKGYDYLVPGKDYSSKMPIAKRCYTGWGASKVFFNDTGMEELYDRFEHQILG